jgi:hypothetical protein
MGVEVHDREIAPGWADGAENGIGDRVVAAEGDRATTVFEGAADTGLDQGARLASRGELEVAGVGEDRSPSGLDARFAAARMSGGASAAPRRNVELAS